MPDTPTAEEPSVQPQDPWARLIESIIAYLNAVKLEEAGQLPEGSRTPTELKPQADAAYWRLMSELISSRVPDNLPDNLIFDEKMMWAFNYGVIKDHDLFKWATPLIAPSMPKPADHPYYTCIYVTQALNQKYRDIRRVDVIKRLNEDLDRIKKAIEDAPAERADAIKRRDGLVKSVVNDAADADKLLALFHQMDEEAEGMKVMEKKQLSGGFGSKEERQRFISLTQMLKQRQEQIDYILEIYKDAAPELRKLHQESDDALTNLMQLREEKRNKEKDIDKESQARHSVSIIDIKAGLEEEVGKLKGNGRLTAKLGKSSQQSMPLEERDIVTPQKAYEALAEIEEYDPNLFNNRGVKRKGKPELIIVPGIGEGIYEWEGNRLLIPTMYTRTIVASVASAVVLYKVDVDQSYNDRELILSYKNDIKEHKKIRSMIKLRQQLIKDYLLWITKESKGFPLMEKPNRQWFEYRIGPNKYEPKLPVDMRNLSLKQTREGLEAEMAKPEDVLTLYRQALFHYLMDPENFEYLNKECVPRLEKALGQDPDNLDVIYSLGAVLRKMKNKKCIELFVDYTKKAPQSWWSKKSLELVTTFK